ncbi:hypothetical protein B0I35DRAFT_472879 [Stachybotrys elegans]|uniref:Gamma interferon inducible lysosomal thiol reductase GILT n=1 Tax=Stachybotrys elegans TaxID=80388 RepID=A0A8K0T6R4_9HYPO|nr:hypothetical protein B0I35DRAFT_472879 [Stachybotrys elegans]
MDEKSTQPAQPAMTNPRAVRRARPLAIITLLLVVAFTLFRYQTAHESRIHGFNELLHSSSSPPSSNSKLVPLEAHIISKCPDTRDALRELILPVMQKVHDKVDFKLSYIGKPTDDDDGVECKHGPSECLGNIIELCARELYPDPKISLGFVMCLTKDYKHIPERALIEDCALEHAIDIKDLNECATRDSGAHGMDLLRSSVQRTADANVTISCTIRLNDEVYCIRDGGEWIDCPHGPGVNDLVLAIEKVYRS